MNVSTQQSTAVISPNRLIATPWMKMLPPRVQDVITCNGVMLLESKTSGVGVTFTCEYLRREFREHDARLHILSQEGGDSVQAGIRQLQSLHGELGNEIGKWSFEAHNVRKLSSALSNMISACGIQLLIFDNADRCAPTFMEAIYEVLDACKRQGQPFGAVFTASQRHVKIINEGSGANTRVLRYERVPNLMETETLTVLAARLPEASDILSDYQTGKKAAEAFAAHLFRKTKGVFRALDNVASRKSALFPGKKLTCELIDEIVKSLDAGARFRLEA